MKAIKAGKAVCWTIELSTLLKVTRLSAKASKASKAVNQRSRIPSRLARVPRPGEHG